MRGRDVRGLVAPDRPGSKRKLKEQESDPPDRQSPQRRDSARVSPNPQTESEHGESDNQREKAMRHLPLENREWRGRDADGAWSRRARVAHKLQLSLRERAF